MKKYSKLLIGLSIVLPVASVAITTPLIFTSTQNTTKNSSIKLASNEDSIWEIPRIGSSNMKILGLYQNIGSWEWNRKLVDITLTGINLNQVKEDDITITNTSKYKVYENYRCIDFINHISDRELQIRFSVLCGRDVDNSDELAPGQYEIEITTNGYRSISYTDFYPSFYSYYRETFNWGVEFRFQIKNALLLTNDHIQVDDRVTITNASGQDVTDNFDLKVSGDFLYVYPKPTSKVALVEDENLNVNLCDGYGVPVTSKPITIRAKTRPVITSVNKTINDKEVTLEVTGASLSSLKVSDLVIIRWYANDSGVFVTDKFTKDESSTDTRLVLKATFDETVDQNTRFDVRLY